MEKGMIAVLFILSLALLSGASGCNLQDSRPNKFVEGDILTPSTDGKTFLLIAGYDAKNDKYLGGIIHQKNDGSWNCKEVVDDASTWHDRTEIEARSVNLATHINLTDIPDCINSNFNHYKVGDLTFAVANLSIQQKMVGSIGSYSYAPLWILLAVRNDGENIQYVHNCGYIIFVDIGQQYDSRLSSRCNLNKVLPHASIKILDNIDFGNYLVGGVNWTDAVERKIDYALETDEGILRFRINPAEVEVDSSY